MRVILIPLLFPVLLLTSCYKDEVDIDALTTNPLDPDYTGPAYITVSNEHLEATSVPGIYNQVFDIHVNTSVFPSAFTYSVAVLEEGTGVITELVQDLATPDDFTFTNFTVTVGALYCYRISVRVELSDSRSEEFCATADL